MNKKQSKQKRNKSESLNELELEELERLRIENRKLEITIALEKKLQSLAREIMELRETGLYMLKEQLKTAGIVKYWYDSLPKKIIKILK